MAPGDRAADVVVIGGGAVGICVALYLQRSGRAVTVVERGRPGDEASGHNGGILSGDCIPTGTPGVVRSVPHMLRDPYSPLSIRWRYLPRLAPWLARFVLASRTSRVEEIAATLSSLMAGAVGAYQTLLAGTEAEGAIRHSGLLFGFREDATFAAERYSLELRERNRVRYELLDGAAIASRHPVLAGRFRHGVYLPGAHFTTDPGGLTRTLAAELVAGGGLVHRAEARGFQRHRGKVRAVVTDQGTLATGSVVICAGPWSRRLAAELGTHVPLDTERGYGLDLPQPGLALDAPVIMSDVNLSLTPHRTGLRVTGIDELAGLSAPANPRLTARVVQGAKAVFPELRTEGARAWMRRRPSLPDTLPVIGPAAGHENVYVAFGHGHKGLCFAAVTGKLVQESMDGKPPSIDLAPLSPERFSRRGRRSRGRASSDGTDRREPG